MRWLMPAAVLLLAAPVGAQENEAENLVKLTGWSLNDVRKKMNLAAYVEPKRKKWWEW